MKRILVIDDDKPLCTTICSTLIRAGFEAVGVNDGWAGLNLYCENKFDLVICDILMPELDGVELIGALRKTDPAAAIIAMSGGNFLGPESYLRIARQLGVNAVLSKPFTVSSLIDTVALELNRGQTPAKETELVAVTA